MNKKLDESSAIKGDNSQDHYNATGEDPTVNRRDAMKGGNKPNAIQFRRNLAEVLDATDNLKLDIPKDLLHPDYKYAWVAENRISEKERLGWELVPDDHFGKNAGISLKRPASKDSDNLLILMATPKEYVSAREDKREQERLIAERGIKTGETDGSGKALDANFVVQRETKIANSMVSKKI